jgi:eukaryotic-like serine/threonine-protein kinase
MNVQNAPIPAGLRSEFEIPPALDALIIECLAKDPDARPASARVVSEQLAATVAADAWTPDAARCWWERQQPLNRMQAMTAAAVEDRTVVTVDLPRLKAEVVAQGKTTSNKVR